MEKEELQNEEDLNLKEEKSEQDADKQDPEEAEKKNINITDPEAREHIYGMPYAEWKEKYQK